MVTQRQFPPVQPVETQSSVPVACSEVVNPEVVYPDSDGKPMADNTKQFRWIVTIKQNIESIFQDNPDVFVAGDLLWYPVEGNNKIRVGPDVMVALGRPKGDRGSYMQWREDNLAPQVVFEILSPGNTRREMAKKRLFYNNYGVEEYYIYNPDNLELEGWMRSPDGGLDAIEEMVGWISPLLGIRFEMGEELQLFRPDGKNFSSWSELEHQIQQEKQRAEQEKQRADEMAALLQQYRDRFGELR